MEVDAQKKLNSFFAKKPLLKYKKGEIIMRPGDTFDSMFYIKSGLIRVYAITSEGKEVTLDVFKPRFFSSFLFNLAGTENNYYFEAIIPVELWKVKNKLFEEFILSEPKLLLYLIRRLTVKFNNILRRCEALISSDSRTKIVSSLALLAERFGEQRGTSVLITLHPSHEDLAGFTGLTRETVSIHMKQLENDGHINYDKKEIIIHNLKNLELMSGYSSLY